MTTSSPSPSQHSRMWWGCLAIAIPLVLWGMFALLIKGPKARIHEVVAEGEAFLPGDASPQVFLRQPVTPMAIVGVDEEGQPLVASCTTCHATRTPDFSHRKSEDLNEFHQGLTFDHADMSCLSCHNPKSYDTLRNAAGETIPFQNVTQLCGQCHQSRLRDFEHGAHGGMNGYWDLSRGPRLRKSCIDCHDPHHPAMPKMQPSFKPQDRFMKGADTHQEDSHE